MFSKINYVQAWSNINQLQFMEGRRVWVQEQQAVSILVKIKVLSNIRYFDIKQNNFRCQQHRWGLMWQQVATPFKRKRRIKFQQVKKYSLLLTNQMYLNKYHHCMWSIKDFILKKISFWYLIHILIHISVFAGQAMIKVN